MVQTTPSSDVRDRKIQNHSTISDRHISASSMTGKRCKNLSSSQTERNLGDSQQLSIDDMKGVSRSPSFYLPTHALFVWRLSAMLMGGFLSSGILVVLWWFSFTPGWRATLWIALILTLASALLEVAVLLRFRHKHYRYECDHQGMRISRGYLFKRYIGIPASRVLYINLKQGPILRKLSLGVVEVGTLGSAHDLGPIEIDRARGIVEMFGSGERHATK